MIGIVPLLILIVLFLMTSLRVLNEYERGVIFRLGRVIRPKGPGLIILLPVLDRMTRVSMRTFAMDVPNQDVITRDNVSIKVNAVVYFRVVDPLKAILEVEDYMYATSQISQTTLRSVCGGVELDEILAHRDKVNEQVQTILDQHAGPWGIKVANVELKYIDLPQEMQRAMAKQAEAERERRAKVINAEGEFRPPPGWPRRPRSSASIPRPCSCAISRPCAKWRPRAMPRPSFPCLLILSGLFFMLWETT